MLSWVGGGRHCFLSLGFSSFLAFSRSSFECTADCRALALTSSLAIVAPSVTEVTTCSNDETVPVLSPVSPSLLTCLIWSDLDLLRFGVHSKPLCVLSDNNRKGFPDKKLDKARSLLYRSQILQEKIRWKALVEIYIKHSFATSFNFIFC